MTIFKCWDELDETEDDAEETEAFDSSSAAEDFAELDCSNSADYEPYMNCTRVVCVKENGSDAVQRFDVGGEATVTFTACECEERKEGE